MMAIGVIPIRFGSEIWASLGLGRIQLWFFREQRKLLMVAGSAGSLGSGVITGC